MKKNNYYKIVTDSMAPLIEAGDMFFIKLPGKMTFKKNDVILFHDQNKKVLHRVVKVKKDQLFLKGDNAYEVQKIKKSEVLGVAKNIFSKDKNIKLGGKREKVFVFFDKVLFQRVLFLRYFKYRVFRYNNMKKIKRLLW